MLPHPLPEALREGPSHLPQLLVVQASLAVAASLLSLLWPHLASPLLPASLLCLSLIRTLVIGHRAHPDSGWSQDP